MPLFLPTAATAAALGMTWRTPGNSRSVTPLLILTSLGCFLSRPLRPNSVAAILQPMQRLSRFLALLAAVMLVIGGAPAVGAAQPCNPCPPDCPMMQQMAASADHHAPTPAKDKPPDNPCKQELACAPFAASVAAPSQTFVAFALAGDAVEHLLADALAAPSRPPDRNLRPPIKL